MEYDEKLEDAINIFDDRIDDGRAPLHETLYQTLRNNLAKGIFSPGQALSLRSLAAEFGGSVTPIRDAVWRLTAEHALELTPTRRIKVPQLGKDQLTDLLNVRALLEPKAASMALRNFNDEIFDAMQDADNRMNKALNAGDVEGYMAHNYDFHFSLYRASGSEVLLPMIEGLWVRFGPFMRHVYPDVAGMKGVEDHHAEALSALSKQDEPALLRAIIADIGDGLNFLLHGLSHD